MAAGASESRPGRFQKLLEALMGRQKDLPSKRRLRILVDLLWANSHRELIAARADEVAKRLEAGADRPALPASDLRPVLPHSRPELILRKTSQQSRLPDQQVTRHRNGFYRSG
jgi:hypothetical protein